MFMPDFPRAILADTGFWFALYDSHDQFHRVACEINSKLDLDRVKILLPWPSLYETLNSRFVGHSTAMSGFTRLLLRPQVVRLSDCGYREKSIETVIQSWRKRPLSLVDMVIRAMLDDRNIIKHGLLTFNHRDFADICRKNRIELITSEAGS